MTTEEKLHYKRLEVEQLITEIEKANTERDQWRSIAIDTGRTLRQIARYAQSTDKHRGVI